MRLAPINNKVIAPLAKSDETAEVTVLHSNPAGNLILGTQIGSIHGIPVLEIDDYQRRSLPIPKLDDPR